MTSYSPTFTAAVATERRNDLIRAAARSRMIADLPDRDRHDTARHRAPWWTRIMSRDEHRTVASGASAP